MIKPLYPIITDTHLKAENVELVVDIFKQFIELIKSRGLKTAIHMGDFFTTRSSQSLNCLLAANEIFDLFEAEEIELMIIPGNHDKTSLVSEKSYLSIVCKNRKYIRLIEQETTVVGIGGVVLHFLPYFREGVEYLGRLMELSQDSSFSMSKSKHVLLTHISINGVRNNDGSVVDGDIEIDFFNNMDLVLSGHYHNRGKVSKKIIYIGSAYQANFGEDTDKGFAILNSDLSIEYVQSKFPIYKKVTIDADDTEKANELLKKYADTEDNIRFVFKGDQQQIESIDANKYTTSGISVQFDNVVDRGVLFDEVEDAEMISFERKSVLRNYVQYANKQQFNQSQMKQGMDMLKEINF